MLKLSKHFIERWGERVGGVPTAREIENIIRESVNVQAGYRARLSDGGDAKIFAIFWHPGREVVIAVDIFTQTVVSVLDKDVKPGHRGQAWGTRYANAGRSAGAYPGYTQLTMHGR